MNKELENTLIKNYEYSQGEDLHFLQKLADDPGFILKSFLGFNGHCDDMWWHAYFVERDKVKGKQYPVSYTHLTLPTILLV